ncbi:HYR domain-containing protein, partial [Aestuariivivens sediminicola]
MKKNYFYKSIPFLLAFLISCSLYARTLNATPTPSSPVYSLQYKVVSFFAGWFGQGDKNLIGKPLSPNQILIEESTLLPPSLTCPGDVNANNDLGLCTAFISSGLDPLVASGYTTLDWTMTGATLASGTNYIGSYTFNVGITTITYIADDGLMNPDSIVQCSFDVEISDVEDPTFTCPSNANINLNSNCEITIPDLVSTVVDAADNCTGIASISQSISIGSVISSSHNNIHIVTITVSDFNGNSSQCDVTLTAIDNTNPVLTPAGNQNALLNGSCEITIPNLVDGSSATDNCSGSTISQNPLAGTSIASSHNATTNVTVTVTDAAGLTDSEVVVITALDNTAPTFSCPGNADISLDSNCEITIPDLVSTILDAADNCTGIASISQSISIGTVISSTHNNNHTITITVSDFYGNISQCDVTLTAKDNIAPIISTVSGSLDYTLQCDDAAGLTAALNETPTATDNCGIPNINLISDVNIPDGSCPNAYVRTRTWNFDDGLAGNLSSSFVQTITVTDTTNPTGTAPADVTVQCLADVPAVNTAAITDEADNCTVNPVVTHVSDSALAPDACGGTITRTYRITDDCGNSIDITQTITVEDNTAPSVTTAAGSLDATLECSNAAGISAALAQEPAA